MPETRDESVRQIAGQKVRLAASKRQQIAADLLTSPGRGPNEAEALIAWMGEHKPVWRA